MKTKSFPSMTLANYLREIRATAFPFPRLGKSAINSASREQLLAWASERKQGLGKGAEETTLRRALIDFEKSMKPMTQRQVAEKAGVSLFLVNKVFTSGKSIRGSGLKKILAAMGCKSDSPECRKALSLWANETGMAVSPEDVDSIVSAKQSALSDWWNRCYPHLIKMTDDQREAVAIAISRPSVVTALSALNSVYEA